MSIAGTALLPGNSGGHLLHLPLLLDHCLILGADRGVAGQVGAAGVAPCHLDCLQVGLLDRLGLQHALVAEFWG